MRQLVMRGATSIAGLLWLATLACAIHVSPAAAEAQNDPSEGKADQLLKCLPILSTCLGKRTVWDDLVQQVPPCIMGKHVWWSKHAPRFPVTLVTQLSVNRLPALQGQCQGWAGPLAAAVYVPLHNGGTGGDKELSSLMKSRLQTAVHAVEELMTWAEAKAEETRANALQLVAGVGRNTFYAGVDKNSTIRPRTSCQLRIILLYEVYAHENATALYPVNSLRNYARLLADTPLITNIDVDMQPSFSLAAALLRGWKPGSTAVSSADSRIPAPGSAADLMQRVGKEKAVFVLPAFETKCGGPVLTDQVSAYSKPQLQAIMADECTRIFRFEMAPQCHNATNFSYWFSLPSEPDASAPPYKVKYEDSFEPWFIGARDQTEWFDIRYRGYGKNKIQQVAHQAYRATQFYVHPTGFIVHRYHDQSAARKEFIGGKKKSRRNVALLQNSLFQHVEDMWEKHFQEIKEGTFKAVIDDTLAECIKTLPWWKDVYR